MVLVAVLLVYHAEVIDEPGAKMSRQVPMLEKDDRASVLVVEPTVMAVKSDSPWNALKDFVDAAAAAPGTLTQSGGSATSADALAGEVIKMKANTEDRVKAVLDVVQTHLVKRKVSLKHLDVPEAGPRLSGKEYHLDCPLKEGITQENAKKINKLIRDEGPKGVKSQIQGDELRVTSKSRDDLQAVQRLLQSADLDVALNFTNYR